MKAMILAAGLGTRLKPITDLKPKALVEVGGVPVLERILVNLKTKGFKTVTLNVHHFADQIIKFLGSKDFGIEIKISDESSELLDTGGGLVKAFSLNFDDDKTPLLVHNVDIINNADLKGLYEFHLRSDNDITLLVNDRESTRKLIFDNKMTLTGWHHLKENRYIPSDFSIDNKNYELAFSGIYIINKEAVEEMREIFGEGKYSVMKYFLHPKRKCKIGGYVQDNLYIIDIGKPAGLAQASEFLKNYPIIG